MCFLGRVVAAGNGKVIDILDACAVSFIEKKYVIFLFLLAYSSTGEIVLFFREGLDSTASDDVFSCFGLLEFLVLSLIVDVKVVDGSSCFEVAHGVHDSVIANGS